MTAAEIKQMSPSKIVTISTKNAQFGQSMQFKIFKHKNEIIIVTRAGLLEYMGDAQRAAIYGTKNKHYKIFKTANAAANFISK